MFTVYGLESLSFMGRSLSRDSHCIEMSADATSIFTRKIQFSNFLCHCGFRKHFVVNLGYHQVYYYNHFFLSIMLISNNVGINQSRAILPRQA